MRIYKISGVYDFMDAIKEGDLESLPPESELSEAQIEEIKKISYKAYVGATTKIKYFFKYPNLIDINYYDVGNCQDAELGQKAFDVLVKDKKSIHGFSPRWPLWLLEKVIKPKYTQLLEVKDIAETILRDLDQYPVFFKNFVYKLCPIYKKYNPEELNENIIARVIKSYYECPNYPDRFFLQKAIKDKPELADYIYTASLSSFKHTEQQRDVWNRSSLPGYGLRTSASVILERIDLLKTNLKIKKPIRALSEEDLFSVVYSYNRSLGYLNTIFLLNRQVDIYTVNEMEKIIRSHPQNSGWYISLKIDNRDIDAIRDKINATNDSIILIKINEDRYDYTDGNIFVLKNTIIRDEDGGSFSSTGAERLLSVADSNAKLSTKLAAIDEWIKGEKWGKKKDEQFYMNLIQHPTMVYISNMAGEALYDLLVNRFSLVQPDDVNGVNIRWGQVTDYYIKTALKLWAEVPERVRETAVTSYSNRNISRYFIMFSGLFSCSKVSKLDLDKYCDKKIEIISNISCMGNVESLRKHWLEKIKEEEKEASRTLAEKWPEFLQTGYVRKKNISDFPMAYQHIQKIIETHADSRWRSKSQVVNTHLEDIAKVPIYLIDAKAFTQTFGNSVDASFSPPSMAKGFFSKSSAIFNYEPTVVVYTNKNDSEGGISELIISELGIKPEMAELSVTEEGTVWHEMAHAILYQMGLFGTHSDDYGSIGGWMSDPNEISAITYGNIPQIRKLIKNYFSKMEVLPPRLERGFLSQIKQDIIKTFEWEFLGMSKEEALQNVKESYIDFDDEVLEMLKNVSQEERDKQLTDMFTSFFIRKFMRSKVEDEITLMLSEFGRKKEELNFSDPVPKEEYIPMTPYSKDEFMKDISQRDDYKGFIQSAQNLYNQDIRNWGAKESMGKWKGYYHKNATQYLKEPQTIEDLNLMLFGAPALINSVHTGSTNPLFSEIIPASLHQYVARIVENEKKLRYVTPVEDKNDPPTPDEAEEAGEMMAEMEGEYGPDWIWTANKKYKIFKLANR